MKRIASILKVSEQGVSKPFVCKDEDGGVRWCKGSHTGFRSLVSEWVCARLAREAGLPVPDFGIFRLDYRDFRAWRGVQNYAVPDLVTEANQFVFGSLNVENSKDVFDFELDLGHIDRQMLSRIYWFDKLIRNTDRTYFNSNLLVNGSVYIIDHNNAFDHEFEKCAFDGEHILRDCRYAISTDEIQAFRARMREIALGPFLEGVWSEMPDTWAEVGDSVLPLCDVRRVIMEGCDG